MKRTIVVDDDEPENLHIDATPEEGDDDVTALDNFPPLERPDTTVYCSMVYDSPAGLITIAVLDVTRELALYWVRRHNQHNRNLRPMRRDSYARDMLAGVWDFNGDTLCIADDGTLVDGQHRLESVIESGVTLPFLVVEGLPMSTQDSKDLNAVRTLADQLKLANYVNPTMLAAVARKLCIIKHGMNGGGRTGHFSPTKREMRKFIDEHKHLITRAVEVSLRSHAVGLPAAPSIIGTAYFLCAEKDAMAAELFFVTKLIESIGLGEDEPARTLQIRLATEANKTTGQMDPELVLRYTILAWNHWRDGRETLERLSRPRTGWPSYSSLVIK